MKPARIRKAWRIELDRYDDAATVYAETRAKTLYGLYLDLETDLRFGQFLKQAKVSRDAARDIRLPARHPLAAQLDPKILSCVVHAFGGTGSKAGYREHYYTSDRDPMPKAAYYHGLFEMHRAPEWYAGSRDMVSYILTDLGKNVARGEAETYPRW
ncbi:hypothetical protein [Bosea sp. (in: a-proteobacteria)]